MSNIIFYFNLLNNELTRNNQYINSQLNENIMK